MENNIPEISLRIKSLIDDKFGGNVRQFCLAMGLENSAKINRLFLLDKRNGSYPMPSADILFLISNTFDVSLDWLYKGEAQKNKSQHVNNINIDRQSINGNNNVTNSNDVQVSKENNQEFIDIIKKQQEQINNLIALLTKSNG